MTNSLDVYQKFGEAAEAAQLLETELGTLLFDANATDEDLLTHPNPKRATDLIDAVNSHTLGQLLTRLKCKTPSLAELEALLVNALAERNRLSHSFYRQHNWRRNSDEGRTIMIKDLESIHDTLFNAYKAVLRLSGIDLEAMDPDAHVAPTRHLPI